MTAYEARIAKSEHLHVVMSADEDLTAVATCSSGRTSGTSGGPTTPTGYITPAAEGLHPARNGVRRSVYVTARSRPGIPIRHSNWKHSAADRTWPNREPEKALQMDHRVHATTGMDAIYDYVTPDAPNTASSPRAYVVVDRCEP